jgi:hypothetical protein
MTGHATECNMLGERALGHNRPEMPNNRHYSQSASEPRTSVSRLSGYKLPTAY